jgi:hypothetical protein
VNDVTSDKPAPCAPHHVVTSLSNPVSSAESGLSATNSWTAEMMTSSGPVSDSTLCLKLDPGTQTAREMLSVTSRPPGLRHELSSVQQILHEAPPGEHHSSYLQSSKMSTDQVISRKVAVRHSSRSQTLTERGHQYSIDQAVTTFKNTVKSLRREVTMTNNSMMQGNVSSDQLFQFRSKLEKKLNEVGGAYYALNSDEIDCLDDLKETYDDCADRIHATLFQITLLLKTIDSQSQSSRRSSSCKESRHSGRKHCESVHTGVSRHLSRKYGESVHSGTSHASIKAQAALKAAALEARLKFLKLKLSKELNLTKLQCSRN